jgi:parallel beta-helix repeat protein
VLNNTLNNENSIPIYFWSTSNSFISKNFIDNAWWGLNVDLGENNTAINNTISNVDYGIEAEATKNFKVIGNNVSNSYYGVVKFRGEIEIASDLITDNILHNNHYGIYIEAYNPNITIQHNTIMNSSVLSVYSQTSTELSYNRQGNYWSRSEYPYFCEYGNQNASCIDNWDSNRPDVIDSCPYNQSYPPGQWPASPRCPTPPVTNQCQSKGGICIDKCPEGYRQVDLSCGQTTTKTTGLFDGLLNFLGRFFLIAPQPAETTTQQTTQPAETPQTTPTTPVVIQPAATTSQPVKPATQTESQIPVTTQTVCCMKI